MTPDPLAQLEREEDLLRRIELIRAAGESGGRRTAARLVALFGVVSDKEEVAVAAALVRIGRPAVAPLCRMLGEGQTNSEDHAVRALGEIGSGAAAVPLAKALGDWHPAIRAAAAEALLKLIERGHGRQVLEAIPATHAQMSANGRWENDGAPLARVTERLAEVLKLSEALPVPSAAPQPEVVKLPLPAAPAEVSPDDLPRVGP